VQNVPFDSPNFEPQLQQEVDVPLPTSPQSNPTGCAPSFTEAIAMAARMIGKRDATECAHNRTADATPIGLAALTETRIDAAPTGPIFGSRSLRSSNQYKKGQICLSLDPQLQPTKPFSRASAPSMCDVRSGRWSELPGLWIGSSADGEIEVAAKGGNEKEGTEYI
jgi:hypothetical protein